MSFQNLKNDSPKQMLDLCRLCRVDLLRYRPPEILLGSTAYGPAADVWGAGCILAELANGAPVFPAENEARA